MVLVVADAFHQAPHEVYEWPLEWLYKAYSLIAYRNEQNDPEKKKKAEQKQNLWNWG